MCSYVFNVQAPLGATHPRLPSDPVCRPQGALTLTAGSIPQAHAWGWGLSSARGNPADASQVLAPGRLCLTPGQALPGGATREGWRYEGSA
jgi:hypothetical protein